jgi:hypothetical protein
MGLQDGLGRKANDVETCKSAENMTRVIGLP